MSKSAKKNPVAPSAAIGPLTKLPNQLVGRANNKKPDAASKQSRVIAMLQSPTGTTIAAMMKATDWQQHSVRGFLAGVVRKRLKLKLDSKKIDGTRFYLITSGDGDKSTARRSKSRLR